MKNLKDFFIFLRQPLIKYSIIAFTALLLLTTMFVVFRWSGLPPKIPLYYSLPWGEKQLGQPWELTIIPTVAVSIFVINLLLAYLFAKENDLLFKVLVITALFVPGLLFYSLIKIIFLVS